MRIADLRKRVCFLKRSCSRFAQRRTILKGRTTSRAMSLRGARRRSNLGEGTEIAAHLPGARNDEGKRDTMADVVRGGSLVPVVGKDGVL